MQLLLLLELQQLELLLLLLYRQLLLVRSRVTAYEYLLRLWMRLTSRLS